MLKKLIKTVNEILFPADVSFIIVGAKTIIPNEINIGDGFKIKTKKFPIDPKTFFIQEITNDRNCCISNRTR